MMNYALICKVAQDLGVTLCPKEEIKSGDYYLAHRNGPVKLLVAREIKDGYIVPVEIEYCYNISECIKVEL